MLTPFELDAPIVDQLEKDHSVVSGLESSATRLLDLANIIAESGMSRTLADNVNQIDVGALESLHPRSFTANPSTLKRTESLEGIFSTVGNFLKRIAEAVLDFIIRALEWLLEHASAMKNTDELKRTVGKYEQLHEYSDELKSKVQERIEALRGSDEYAGLATVFEELLSGAHPEVKEAMDQAKSSYTVLVRSSFVSREDTLELLDYTTYLGTADRAFQATAEEFMNVVRSIHEDSSVDDILMALDKSVQLHDTFQAALNPICERILRLRLYGIKMPKLDRENPDRFLTEFRSSLMTAAMTVDTHSVADDIPNITTRTQTIIDIAKRSDDVLKAFTKRKSEYDNLRKMVGKLRKMAQDKSFGRTKVVENEQLVRDGLLIANRGLRNVTLSIMRLREIPEIYAKSHKRFIGRHGYALVTQAALIKDL